MTINYSDEQIKRLQNWIQAEQIVSKQYLKRSNESKKREEIYTKFYQRKKRDFIIWQILTSNSKKVFKETSDELKVLKVFQ